MIWTLGCVVLSLVYGFRRRWAETLDGFNLLQFGADFSNEIREAVAEARAGAELEDCKGLRLLPGLVGDTRVGEEVGHIGLVARGNEARRDKRYA